MTLLARRIEEEEDGVGYGGTMWPVSRPGLIIASKPPKAPQTSFPRFLFLDDVGHARISVEDIRQLKVYQMIKRCNIFCKTPTGELHANKIPTFISQR